MAWVRSSSWRGMKRGTANGCGLLPWLRLHGDPRLAGDARLASATPRRIGRLGGLAKDAYALGKVEPGIDLDA